MPSKRVLLIDDEVPQVEDLKGYFRRFQHGYQYDLMTASAGPEIAAAIRQGRPDLIMLDPQIKSMDGLALLKQLRKLDSAMPMIIITGKQSTQAAEQVLKTGIFAYVPKPCDYQQLEHLVALVFSDLFKGAGAR